MQSLSTFNKSTFLFIHYLSISETDFLLLLLLLWLWIIGIHLIIAWIGYIAFLRLSIGIGSHRWNVATQKSMGLSKIKANVRYRETGFQHNFYTYECQSTAEPTSPRPINAAHTPYRGFSPLPLVKVVNFLFDFNWKLCPTGMASNWSGRENPLRQARRFKSAIWRFKAPQ